MDRDERVRAESEAARTTSSADGHVVAEIADELERLRVEIAQLLLRDVLGRRDRRARSRLSPTSPSRSYDETAKPCLFARPRTRIGVPETSFVSSHGWLNQVALISPVSSATRAVRILSRPRRRLDTERTTPSMTASSSPNRSQIRLTGAGSSYRRGRCQSRSSTMLESEACKAFGHRRTDAVQRLDRRSEPISSRSRARPRPGLGRVEPGEAP